MLVLTNNKIVTLPESISNMPSLEELNLSVNKIAELPRGFGAFAKLKMLDLSYNNITGTFSSRYFTFSNMLFRTSNSVRSFEPSC